MANLDIESRFYSFPEHYLPFPHLLICTYTHTQSRKFGNFQPEGVKCSDSLEPQVQILAEKLEPSSFNGC